MAAPGSTSSYPSTAYILSLIGGILILIGGIATAIIAAFIGAYSLSVIPGLAALAIAFGIVALILGIVILYLAMQLRQNPRTDAVHNNGIIILVLAIVSIFVGGGGFYIGAILAIIGGILALVWKPGS
jgi:energy-converting hydrogenase Eha subunit A